MRKGDHTRRTVLNKALFLSSRLGLETLSIGRLAKSVGMSKSGLFAHFNSKEELQMALLDHAFAHFVERVVDPALHQPRGEPRVRALFENWLEWDRSPELPGGCVFISFAHEYDDQPGVIRTRLVAAQRKWEETLAEAVRIAVREGHFSEETDPRQFVFEGHGLVLSYHYYKRLLRDEGAATRAVAAFDGLIRRSRRMPQAGVPA